MISLPWDSSISVMHYDPSGLGLICLVQKREIPFGIFDFPKQTHPFKFSLSVRTGWLWRDHYKKMSQKLDSSEPGQDPTFLIRWRHLIDRRRQFWPRPLNMA